MRGLSGLLLLVVVQFLARRAEAAVVGVEEVVEVVEVLQVGVLQVEGKVRMGKAVRLGR